MVETAKDVPNSTILRAATDRAVRYKKVPCLREVGTYMCFKRRASSADEIRRRSTASIARRPGIFDQRRETVEHPFGSIKQWMNQGAFLMRGLEKVRGEFSLTALAYNLRRVLNIVELPKLIAALPA